MARALRESRAHRPGRSLASPLHLPACDTRPHRAADPRAAAALSLGRAEGALAARPPRAERARAHGGHRAPDSRAAWPHRPPACFAAPLSQRPPRRPARSTECDLDRRFQRAVSHRQWHLLLPAHDPGRRDAILARLPRLARADDRRELARVSPAVPALWPVADPGHYEERRVSRNGGIRWDSRWVNVSHVLAELDVGFEEIDDGLWEVYFGPVWLGRLHETTGRIVDHLGRPARREGGNHKGKCFQSPDNKVSPII